MTAVYDPPRCVHCGHPQSVHETSRGYNPGHCHMHGGCNCTEWRKAGTTTDEDC